MSFQTDYIGSYGLYSTDDLNQLRFDIVMGNIGNYVFCNCYKLTSITIENNYERDQNS